ncbi:hypothetical protein [Streptomyces bambusae]|uniref:Uncharacterized protein n=1 Tax=Streptomyces bambusae TaxID=1550616 RepID=A0ABS6Z6T7_9ACTN|nr:hypothetical protein [Streptomyces bambusae]MBW5483286.1 hypothetical protein [Streptomyces bambusae]
MSRPEIEIFWPASLPSEPAAAGEDMLRGAGIETSCLLRPVRRGGVSETVVVLVSSAVLEPFLRTLFQRVADEAASGLKAFVGRLLERPAEGAPTPDGVVIESSPTGARFRFTADLPDAAYEQVVGVDAGDKRWAWDHRLALWTPG